MASLRGTATLQGWARKTYFVSKALETAMTIALARENPGFYINACCPGWVNTDLGNQAGAAPKTVGKQKSYSTPIAYIYERLSSVLMADWLQRTVQRSQFALALGTLEGQRESIGLMMKFGVTERGRFKIGSAVS